MENTHQSKAPAFKILDGQKTDFNAIWSNFMATLMPAIELFKQDPANFFLIYAIPVVLAGVIAQILVPVLFGGLILSGGLVGLLIGLVVFLVCAIALNIIAYLALVKAVVEKGKGNKIDIAACFSLASKNVVSSIVLSIKVFLTIFQGIHKFINSFLSLIFFIEHDGKDVDAAIKMSQDASEGKTITLVWNYVMIAIATSIASSIIAAIWMAIFVNVSYYVANLSTYIASGIASSFAVLFHYVMKTQIEKAKGEHAPAAHHTPVSHS